MGRQSVNKTQLLEDSKKREITYSKRKRNILRHCIEFSKMCNQDISLTMFDKDRQKLVQYSSSFDFSPKVATELLYPENIVMCTYKIYNNDSYEEITQVKKGKNAVK